MTGVHAAPYKDIVLFLIVAGVAAPLFRRARIAPIFGFLAAGVALGPHGLGALAPAAPWLGLFSISHTEEFAAVGELGVVFLLFSIGLELSWERLRVMRRIVFRLGVAQVAATTAAVTALALALGQPWRAAVSGGAALALSSTAVVLPSLAEYRRLNSEGGRAILGTLLFQDLTVAPILIALSLPARAGGAGASAILAALATGIVGVAALAAAGRLLLRPLLRSVAHAGGDELFTAASLLAIVSAGLIAAAFGLSMAVGALIAGLILAETEYRHQVEVLIEPFKGLLLGAFFLSLGIGLDTGLLVRRPALILGLATGLLLLKGAIAFALSRLAGLRRRPAAEAALGLAAGGEFAFVILAQAVASALAPASLTQPLLVAVALTMIAAPALVQLGGHLGRAPEDAAAPPPGPEALPPESCVLVAGYGRVGRLVGEMLGRLETPWTAVDANAAVVERARRDGRDVVFGDASRLELLRRCRLESARALVVTLDDPAAAIAATAAARAVNPRLPIIARARDAEHARRLYAAGASDAAPETVEASLQLAEAALIAIGIPMGRVIAEIHERRDGYRAEFNPPAGKSAPV